MSPQNAPRSYAIQIFTRLLMPRLLGRADVRVQLPVVADAHSVPEPDLTVVALENYRGAHPTRAFLIIEVADSSLKLDRQEKAELYARAGVPEYWVVNLADRIIERYTEPTSGAYARVTPFRSGETIQPLAFADAGVRVNEVFGD